MGVDRSFSLLHCVHILLHELIPSAKSIFSDAGSWTNITWKQYIFAIVDITLLHCCSVLFTLYLVYNESRSSTCSTSGCNQAHSLISCSKIIMEKGGQYQIHI